MWLNKLFFFNLNSGHQDVHLDRLEGVLHDNAFHSSKGKTSVHVLSVEGFIYSALLTVLFFCWVKGCDGQLNEIR